jgi:glutathione S-transferase
VPPKGTPGRERADGLNRLERALFGRWMQWLTAGLHSCCVQQLTHSLKARVVSTLEPEM